MWMLGRLTNWLAVRSLCCRELLLTRIISCEVLWKVLKPSLWKVEKNLMIETIGRNIFLFRFESARDCDRVLKTDPWSFDKALLILQKPSRLIKSSLLEFKFVSFWTHFLDLTLEYMNEAMTTW